MLPPQITDWLETSYIETHIIDKTDYVKKDDLGVWLMAWEVHKYRERKSKRFDPYYILPTIIALLSIIICIVGIASR